MTATHFATEAGALQARSAELDALQIEVTRQGEAGLATALSELKSALAGANAGAIRAAARQVETAVDKVSVPATGKPVLKFIAPLQSKRTGTLGAVLSVGNLQRAAGLGLIYFGIAAVVVRLLGGRVTGFILGFPLVFALAWVAQMLAGNSVANELGLEYVIFALGLGLLLNHTLPLPAWLSQAVRTEFYIKTGLVILGAGILFQENHAGGRARPGPIHPGGDGGLVFLLLARAAAAGG